MKLTKKALKAIKSKHLYPYLAIALNVSTNAIYRYVRNNDDDLTKAAALKVIREHTGFEDSQILEEEGAVKTGTV